MAELPVHLSASNEEIGPFAQERFEGLVNMLVTQKGQVVSEDSIAIPPLESEGLGEIHSGIAGVALHEIDDMTSLTLSADYAESVGDSGYQTSRVYAEIMNMSEPVDGVGTVDDFECYEVNRHDGEPETHYESGIIALDEDENEIADDLAELVNLLSTLDNLKQEQPDNLAIDVLMGKVNRRLSRAMIEHDDQTPFTYEHYRKIMKVLRQAAGPSDPK